MMFCAQAVPDKEPVCASSAGLFSKSFESHSSQFLDAAHGQKRYSACLLSPLSIKSPKWYILLDGKASLDLIN